MNGKWFAVKLRTPPEGVVVETKIDDANGVRNEQTLLREGRLWFSPDMGLCVYYTPTHWRPIEAKGGA